MTNTFKIGILSDGPDQDDWDDLQDILGEADMPMRPEWNYAPFSGYVDLDDGSRKGTGLPIASWHWNAVTAAQRETLKAYCPLLSNEVYIMTPINNTSSGEIIWGAFNCQMLWPEADEDKDVDNIALGLTISFRLMEEIGEYL